MTWQELIKAFEKERLRNVELIRIAKRIEAGTLTFEQASLYARILGDVLGRLYGETGIFPDGVTEREALTVLKPSLTRAYSVASGPAMAAQEIQNQKFGVPLKAWRPTIKPGRIEGLAVELAMNGYKQENFTPQVVNVTQSAVDDTMSVNSYNLVKEGYETTYLRKLNGEKSCAYCQALAGEHTAKDAPEGFFGHHRNCVCTIEIVGMAKRGKGYAKEYGREKKRRERIETRKAVEGVQRPEPTPDKLAERAAVRGLADELDTKKNRQIRNFAKLVDNMEFDSDNPRYTEEMITAELNKSPIGRRVIDRIIKRDVIISVSDLPESGGYRGYQEGSTIKLFSANIANTRIAAQTLIHEMAHYDYHIGNCQHAEAVCFAMEKMHIMGRDYLTQEEWEKMVKLAKDAYPEYEWEDGGYGDFRQFDFVR
jgi:hypothetical protein